jgi:hypothetical protein
MPATCLTCGKPLTSEEFHACAGLGHYCAAHLCNSPKRADKSTKAAPKPRKRSPRKTGLRRGQRTSESGVLEYSCKAQFAGSGVIRSGWLTSEHASCPGNTVVFVHKKIGYGPGEIVTLFIKDSDGRRLAERAGYECHE